MIDMALGLLANSALCDSFLGGIGHCAETQQAQYNNALRSGYSQEQSSAILGQLGRGQQNAFCQRLPLFPRSDYMKFERMDRLVKWRRDKSQEKHVHYIKLFMAWTCLPPLALLVIGVCWRAFIYFVVA